MHLENCMSVLPDPCRGNSQHNLIQMRGHRTLLFRCTCSSSLSSMVGIPFLAGFLLPWKFMSTCLLLNADTHLPHPLAIEGGLGPSRWLSDKFNPFFWGQGVVSWWPSPFIISGIGWASITSSFFHILLKQSSEKQNHKFSYSTEETCDKRYCSWGLTLTV